MSLKRSKVFVIGAGGHSRPLIALLDLLGHVIEGIYDDSLKFGKGEKILSSEVRGTIAESPKDLPAVIAVGDIGLREKLFSSLGNRVLKENLIHPTAHIEQNVKLGYGNQVLGNVYMNTDAVIGDNNIINTGAIIEHEANIGSHCHVSVGTVVCGRVRIGDRCFIGAGSVIIDKISICDDVIIGANSTVVDDVKEGGTYVGSPARKIK